MEGGNDENLGGNSYCAGHTLLPNWDWIKARFLWSELPLDPLKYLSPEKMRQKIWAILQKIYIFLNDKEWRYTKKPHILHLVILHNDTWQFGTITVLVNHIIQ